jgi:hypothetical protein
MKKITSFSSLILLALFLFSNLTFSQSPTVQSVTSFTDEGTLKIGDQIEIKVIFSEAVTVTGTPQLTLETGSTVDDAVVDYSGGSGDILNFMYTVVEGHSSSDLDYKATTSLALNGGSIKAVDDNSDATLTLVAPGSNGSLGEAKNYVIDGVKPTITITASQVDTGNTSNDSSLSLTFTSSESNTSFSSDDLSLTNGTITNFSGSGSTYTATFTPSSQGATAINISADTFTDAAGNPNKAATEFTWLFDSGSPSLTLISGISTPNNSATPSITFNSNEAGTITSSLSFSTSATAASGNNLLTFSSLSDNTYSGVTVTLTDAANNSSTLTLDDFVIDTTSPAAFQSTTVVSTGGTVVSTYYNSTNTGVSVTTPIAADDATLIGGTLQIQAKVGADGTYEEIGDEAAITDSGTQVVSLSTVEDLNNFAEGVVLYFRAVITDSAGNVTTGTASATTLTVDREEPEVSAFSMDDVALQSGDTATVTLTFNEAVTGFNSDDDITEESGTLGTMTSDDDTAWTGTFTPSANTTDSSNTLTLATTYTDVAGNPGPTATTANYTVDTAANTVESFEMDDVALKSGETSEVTLTFSEAVTGFNSDNDITAPNGTLEAMTSNNDITWTGTFTPDADTTDDQNVLTLAADSYTDAAGNNGPGATTANYAVDTDLPGMTTVSIASSTSNPTNAATRATTDQTVTLTIDADEDIAQPTVAFESGGANINGSVTYTDNNDSDASTWTASYTVNSGDTDGSVTFTLDFDDLAGNSGAQVTTVTDNSSVEVDQTAITLSSLTIASNNNNTSLAKADNTITLTIVAAENYSSAPTVTFTGANGNVTVAQGNDAATYTASYTVQSNDTNGPLAFTVTSTDAAGNESTNTALIQDNSGVTIDTTAPVITLTGNSTVTHEAQADYTDAGASVTDNLDSSVSDNLDSTSNVNKDLIGSYTVVYSATDAAGNAAVDVTRTVNVVDTTIPVISRIGNEAVDHEAATAYTDEGATAADAYDGNITDDIVTVNNVDTDSALGDYTVTYNVVDANDNPAEQVTRTVTVVDTTAPVITRNGDAEVTVERLATYTDAGATASDTYYGNITSDIVTVNPVNTSVSGTYTVTYNVTDASSNEAQEVTRTVIVEDTTAPTLTSVSIASNGNSDGTLAKADNTVTLTFTSNEAIGTPTVTFTSGSPAQAATNDDVVANPGDGNTYTATYTVDTDDTDGAVGFSISFSDTAGNAGVAVTAVTDSSAVTVDTTAPSIDAIATTDFDWGAVLNSSESASNGTVTVTTSGVENNQTLTLTLGDNDYTTTVSGNENTVTIPADILGGLTHGDTYNFTANVSDAAGNEAAEVTSSNFTVDTAAPTVSFVTSTTENGTYKAGDEIVIKVTFNTIVNVTGTPTITLATGDNGDIVDYTDGSATKFLLFTYTVGEGDTSADLDYVSTTALALSGGTIKDVNGNAAVLTLPAPGATNSLAHSKALVVDTTAPTMMITSTTVSSGTTTNDATIALTFTSSEATTNFAAEDITLSAGSINNTFAASGDDGTTYTAIFTPNADATFTLSIGAGTFTDAVGNTSEASNTFTWTYDSTAPTVTITGDQGDSGSITNVSAITLSIDVSETPTGFAASDVLYSSAGDGTGTFGALTATGSSPEYTITFTPDSSDTYTFSVAQESFTDAVGNNNDASNNFEWQYDGTVPTVTGVIVAGGDDNYKEDEDVTIEVTFSEAVNVTDVPELALNTGATASYTDGDGTATLTFTYTVDAEENTSDLDYAATTSLSGTIKDLYGNDANLTLASPGAEGSISQGGDVVIDTTVPVITLDGNSTVTHEAKANYTDAGASVTDNLDSSVSDNLDSTSNVNKDLIGSYTVVYSATDAAGNAAVDVTRTVNVVDTTIPVITRIGNEAVDHEAATAYTDEGATAADAYDGDITGSIVTVNPVDTDSALGDYTVTYNVVDANDNPAEQVTRTVTVVDTTAPVITRNGDAEVTVERLATYTDAGATASDSYYGNITDDIVTVNPVDTSVSGTYTVTYNVTDASSNEAQEVTRTVIVEDTTAPTLTSVSIASNGTRLVH